MSELRPSPIAIVGMACRLPGGSDNPDKLWDMLSEGRSGWREIPEDRWNKDAFYHPEPEAKEAVNFKGLYFLDQDITAFDARFFNIHPHEAHCLDPQQRILLETTYEALENAGQTIAGIKGSDTSVHVGAYATDFERMGYKDTAKTPKAHMIGTGIAILSNRISYVFDLKGPSSTVDTGCSGSMVALHQACHGLRARESKMAIVAGTQLVLTPDQIIPMSTVGMTNPDGKCYVFDSRGAGYARGEGVVSFVLKRLDDAIQDGDVVHAIIRNSGLNQDGKTVGLTLPNPLSQASLMRQVYKNVGLDPADTSYVEAHGTGTQAGDNAEISSIAEVFNPNAEREGGLYVGSIKSNIGHLEASSGVAGLLKAVLILKHGQIPPNIDFIKPKPTLLLEERNVKIATEMTPLPVSNGPRRVSVNSFGYGGTNAHVILEAAPSDKEVEISNGVVGHSETNGYVGVEEVVSNGVNGHTNGVNGHSNGTNGHIEINGTNGHAKTNGANGHIETNGTNGHAKEIDIDVPAVENGTNGHDETNGTNGHSIETNGTTEVAEIEAQTAENGTNGHFETNGTNGHAKENDVDVPVVENGTNGHAETNGTNGHSTESNGINGDAQVVQVESRAVDNDTNGHVEANANGDEPVKTEPTNGQAEEPVQPQEQTLETPLDTQSPELFVLSARSEPSLQTMVTNLHKWASSHKDASYFPNLAYTLSTRRSEMSHRFSTAASTHQDLLAQLEQTPRITKAATSFRSVFLFTGQGAQWHAMGRELTESQPLFRESMLKSDRLLKDLGAEWSLIEELSKNEKESRVGEAEISQPSTTAIQLALIDLLKSFNVLPDFVLGHSSGEIAAGYAAGALDHETAIEVSYRRGFMSQACARVISSKGAMMAVGLGEEDVQPYIDQTRKGLICVACVNSPVSTTISGDETAIDELKEILDQESIFARKLKVDTAYHSHHMKKVAGEYLQSIAHIKTKTPNPDVKFYSSVLVAHKTTDFDAQYWVDNLVSPVRFGNALELLCRTELANTPLTFFTEIGPHGALAGPVRQTIKSVNLSGFKSNYISTLARGRDGVVTVLEAAGKLFEFGYPVSLAATLSEKAKSATMVDNLTPYAWDHSTSYLYESNLSKQHRFRAHPPHDLLGLRVPGTTNQEPTWRNFLGVGSLPWLSDHVVDGFAIYPAAAYLCMAIEAARQISVDRKVQGTIAQVHLKNMTFSKSIMIPERRTDGLTSDVEILLTLRPAKHLTDRTWETFRIMALSTEDVWHEHCAGSIMLEWTGKEDEVEGTREETMANSQRLKDLQEIIDGCDTEFTGLELYDDFADNGNVYGPTFNGIQSAKIGTHGGVANISIPDVLSVMPRQYQQPHVIHPSSFDSIFQLGLPIYRRNVGTGPVMPTSIDEITINCKLSSDPGTKWVASTTMTETGFRFARVEVAVFEEQANGEPLLPVIDIRGGSLRGIGEAPVDESTLPFNRKSSYGIKWKPDVDLLASSEQSQLVEYLDLLAFKQPHMKILEIGAGAETGVSLSLIEAIDHPEGLLLDRYSYTDVNSEALDRGKASLQKWIDRVDFKTLDITKDPTQQGFQASYDLVIVSDAFKDVESVDDCLANAVKLLTPSGRLVLGTSGDEWSSRLEKHGYQSTTPEGSQLIVATPINAQTHQNFPSVHIINHSQSDVEFTSLADSIKTQLTNKGFSCSLDNWSSQSITDEPIYIVLDNATDAILSSPTEDQFAQVVSLLTKAKSVLWVSSQPSGVDVHHPAKGMINGLSRVVRRENGNMKLVTVDVQDDIIATPESLVSRIQDLIARSFATPISVTTSDEDEYTLNNGHLLIPRVHADATFDEYVKKSIYAQDMETGLFHQEGRPVRLEVETPGLLSSLRFVDDEVPSKTLGPCELELEAKAYGVNFKDVFIAMGQMIPGVTMAGECVGTVRQVGSSITDRFNVGDRVCGIFAEPFSSRPRVNGNISVHLPESMPYSVGASIPVVFGTAYHCIVEVARLERGQTILIHAASGGVGQAAIQLAQNIGAEIFCTVGSTAKRQLIIDTFNIPPSHIFSSRLRTFKQGVMRLTQNKGVDCVLNSMSGESLHDSFSVVAPLGTFVEIGKSDIYRKNDISMVPFDSSITFAAVDLTVLAKIKPAKMRETLEKVFAMFADGTLKPVAPIREMPMTDIEEAFRLIQSRKHTGKVVLVAGEDTQVKLTVARPKSLSLDKNGTYVISGGLGDLGRRIARFLATRGAGHVVTLSRRTLPEEERLAFEGELRALGAQLHIIACDVTNEESVKRAAEECAANLPNVKGVVHAGMVLRDHPLELMSLEDYMAATKPKVQGTRNLDNAFASDSLDFFIMLSSITAILGTAGQSNYAVGNSYQDAYAQSKKDSKSRYVALNLGAVDGSLAITSLPTAQQEQMRRGSVLMSFDEVFTVLGYAMSPQASEDGLRQLILGFDRKSMVTVHDEAALANPRFSQVPYLDQEGETKKEAASDIGVMIQQASSPEELESIVILGICQRFALFTAVPVEEINPDIAMDSFGLDSLVAIELKNYLMRTFQVALQTSEVLDATNIRSLAHTIIPRSRLVSRDVEAAVVEKEEAVVEKALQPTIESASPGANHNHECCKAFKTLHKMPIVDFETMFDSYLEKSRMFFTPEDFSTIERDVAKFREPGSTGRKFYERLYQQAHDPNIENWQDKYFMQSMYLERRMPLAPFNNFMAFHPLGEMGHTQAERAALIANIAFQSKQDLESGRWGPMKYLTTFNCSDLWRYIFNTARLPGVPLDRMAKFPGNDYAAVLHRGHIYKLDLINGDDNVSIEALTKTFSLILEREDTEENWTSILSADDRTAWAENRDTLIGLDIGNKETIDMVEASAFLICLDDTEPKDAEDRIRQMMMLEGFNRWVDKSIAFVVCKNATSGTYVEHTCIDALTLFAMQTALVDGIKTYKPPKYLNGHANGIVAPKEFTLKTTPALEERVVHIRQRFLTEINKFGYRDIILSEFGKDTLLEHHLPIKGIYDLLGLLANYYYYGYNAQSWEAVSMSHYHKGRPDIVQVNTPITADFCTIADDESIPAQKRFGLMVEAATARNKTIKDALFEGRCYQRTLRALELCAEEGEELPDLFKNPLYEQTVEPNQMFSNTDGLSPESCFIMQNPDRFWMTYYVTDAGSHWSVITGKEEVIRWADCLQRASVVFKSLIDAA